MNNMNQSVQAQKSTITGCFKNLFTYPRGEGFPPEVNIELLNSLIRSSLSVCFGTHWELTDSEKKFPLKVEIDTFELGQSINLTQPIDEIRNTLIPTLNSLLIIMMLEVVNEGVRGDGAKYVFDIKHIEGAKDMFGGYYSDHETTNLVKGGKSDHPVLYWAGEVLGSLLKR